MRRDTAKALLAGAQARLEDRQEEDLSDAEVQVLFATLSAALLAAVTSLGECRRQRPFSPLRPIIDVDGSLKWCCNHDPEHCAS